MNDATKTAGIYIVFDLDVLEQIDRVLEQLNAKLPSQSHSNRQDFIRMAVHEKLEQLPKDKSIREGE